MFGTLEFLQKLCNCKTIFMDGTFYISPEIFSQMYTLHGFYRGQMIFFLYALLPNKTKQTYVRLFRLLINVSRANRLQFNPEEIFIDFEIAVIEAINYILPLTQVHGCLFHFT